MKKKIEFEKSNIETEIEIKNWEKI